MIGLRYGFSTLGEPGLGVEGLLRLAHDHGCLGIELRLAAGEMLTAGSTPAQAADLGDVLGGEGLSLLSLSAYVELCDVENGDAGAGLPGDPVMDALEHHLELASAAGAVGVRVFMKDPDPVEEGLSPGERRAANRLHAALAVVARTGARILIETHDSHGTAARTTRFLHGAGLSPGEGVEVIWDTAHSWAGGEAPGDSLALLTPWLAHLQVKDVLRTPAGTAQPVEPGAGSYPIAELTAATSAWAGWAVLEWERAWHPELSPLASALDATRSWAAALLGDDQARSS